METLTFEQAVRWLINLDDDGLFTLLVDIRGYNQNLIDAVSTYDKIPEEKMWLLDLLHRFYTQEITDKEIPYIFNKDTIVHYETDSLIWWMEQYPNWKFRKPLPELLKQFKEEQG